VVVATRFVRMKWGRPLRLAGGATLLAASTLLLAGFRPLDSRIDRLDAIDTADVVIPGQVESTSYREVGSPFAGQVAKMAVRTGDEVKKGQLLFRMDTRALEEQLAQAKSAKNDAWKSYQDGRDTRDRDARAAKQQIEDLETAIAHEHDLAASASQAAAQPDLAPQVEDGSQPATDATAPQPYDPARLQDLQTRLETAKRELQEKSRDWDRSLWANWQEYTATSAQVNKLHNLVASADRRAPAAGKVGDVMAKEGSEIDAYLPIVRVDDPAGFRVVSLVDDAATLPLKQGTFVQVKVPQGRLAGQLEKIQSGWDRQIFESYLWVKPDQPNLMMPGQSVDVTLPAHPVQVASK